MTFLIKGKSTPPATAGFTPAPAKPAAQRGDTGKGPLPKTCCGNPRNVKLDGKTGK